MGPKRRILRVDFFAFLPMWLLAISLNGKKHVAAINGQIGAAALDARGKKDLQSKRRDRFV